MTEIRERAGRNRTITLTKEEYNTLSINLPTFKVGSRIELSEIINKTINNDLFDIVDLLPKQFRR